MITLGENSELEVFFGSFIDDEWEWLIIEWNERQGTMEFLDQALTI